MTKSEYQQLVEFIAPKFDAIDRRFDQVDKRFDQMDSRFDRLEERVNKVELYAEENRHLIQLVAEGVRANSEALERFKAEVASEFAAVRREMAQGFRSVHEALGGLDGRVRALEARIA